MAVKASSQITVYDVTDGYTINLSKESHIFNGNTTGVDGAQSFTVKITAYQGPDTIPASVNTNDISVPTGLTVTKDNDANTPTLTFSATTALTEAVLNTFGRVLTIPIKITSSAGDILTYYKTISISINLKNVTITAVEYQSGTSATTAPTGTWSSSVVSVAEGNYLWTRTTYSDGTKAYAVSKQGKSGTNGTNGTSPTVTSTVTEYQQADGGTTVPTGTWDTTPPTATANKYMWTRVTVTYSDGKTAISYTVSKNGTNGTSPTDYAMSVTHAAINRAADGTYNPTSVTASATSQAGNAARAAYKGRFKYEYTTDNSTWTAVSGGTSTANESSRSCTIPNVSGLIALRVSLYAAGGTTTLFKQQVIPIVDDGSDGDDAISIAIISSAGTVFKNTNGSTVLTAHVYKGGAEVTGTALSDLGTIKWYKTGTADPVGTGASLTVTAAQVQNIAAYVAQLES